MSFAKKNVYACHPKVARAMPVVMGAHPKGETFTYANGTNFVIRNVENPLDAFTYTEHSAETTCAKYAPSGYYICSADVTGKVRIWDTTQETHMLKYEYRPLSGAIRDLGWTEDSKRIVVCGEGNEMFARAFLWDSGSSVGELSGHSKKLNSCDVKQNRPYRVATASEDTDIGFYAGPPFKRDHLNTEHARFVNVVRFAPNGNGLLSGGADGKVFLYDGKDGKLKHEVKAEGADSAHESSVCGLSWSADSVRAVSCSTDKTVKMWDVEANTLLTTFTFGDDLGWQQLGCLWMGETILTVSLNGYLNYLDPANPSKPLRSLHGHNKSIQSLAVVGPDFISGGVDGRVYRTNIETGATVELENSHGNSVVRIVPMGDKFATVSLDDTVRFTASGAGALEGNEFKCECAPVDGAAGPDDTLVVALVKEIAVLQGGAKVASLAVSYDPLSVAMNANGDIAVGDKGKHIHIYTVNGNTLAEKKVLDATGEVMALAYSPDGKFLASGDANKNVYGFDVAADYELKFDRWKYHTAKITCLAWSPSSQHIASGSLDTNIMIWSLEKPMNKIKMIGAHPNAPISAITWLSDTVVGSAGIDACIRTFDITHA